MKNIFLFGECMIELMTVSQEKSSTHMKQSFAGDVFNTAVYLKRTFNDINVNLVSAVGQDKFSLDMIQYFKNESIGTDFVFQSGTKIPGLYAIQLDEVGERSFIYWRENSAARQVMQHINDNVVKTLSQGDMFFFSGISLAVVAPDARPSFWSMVEKLKIAGVNIVFDPNYRARMWESKAQAKTQFEQAFTHADVLLPGVDDFEQLYGLSTSQAVYDFCKPYQFNELIIKNGEAGICCYINDQAYQFSITPIDSVVDTTSAGDSFNGVYLGARAKGYSLEQAIDLASKSAAFVIQHYGAIVESEIHQQFIKEQLSLVNK